MSQDSHDRTISEYLDQSLTSILCIDGDYMPPLSVFPNKDEINALWDELRKTKDYFAIQVAHTLFQFKWNYLSERVKKLNQGIAVANREGMWDARFNFGSSRAKRLVDHLEQHPGPGGQINLILGYQIFLEQYPDLESITNPIRAGFVKTIADALEQEEISYADRRMEELKATA